MRPSFWISLSCLALSCRAQEEAPRSEPRPLPAEGQPSAPAPTEAQIPEPRPSIQRDPAPREGRVYRVAALGDSITDERVGGGQYLAYLRRACPRSAFFHFGKGGDMTNQMLVRLERDLLPDARRLGLDTLLVLGGVNDLYSDISAHRTNERIEGSLESIYDRARAQGLRTIGITVLPWGGFSRYFTRKRGESTRALNAWILGQVARGKLDGAVDAYPRLSCGEPEKLCPSFERPRPDGLHPGPDGHIQLGKLLHSQIFPDCL